jgi:hypothetical protein
MPVSARRLPWKPAVARRDLTIMFLPGSNKSPVAALLHENNAEIY